MKYIALVLIIASLALIACGPQVDLGESGQYEEIEQDVVEEETVEFDDEFGEDEFIELEEVI